MNLKFIHICENAFISEGGKLNLIGIFKVIKVKKIPGGIPKFNILLNIENPTGKIDKNIVPTISGIFPKIQKGGTPNINFNIEIVNYKFFYTGNYKFLINFNGKKVGDIKLVVVQSDTEKN